MTRSYHKLIVWRKSVDLAKAVYILTGLLPADERFGLVSQMRRCAVSIASNIAEGASRRGNKEFLQFLYIARGSLAELETQLTIAEELEFVAAENSSLGQEIDDIFGLLNGLINSLTRSSSPNQGTNS